MAGNYNPGYPSVVAGRAADNNTPTDIFMDTTAGALYTGAWVWNTSTLAWEKMTQPVSYTQGDWDSHYQRMKPYLYGSGRPKYICRNTDIDANETDTDWTNWKY